ncbi:hypothetical protein PAMP_020626 [Pampus punctatissimus]
MGSAPQTAKGTKEGPSPPPPHSSPPPLRSPILQGADSSKIRKPASPPPAQPHFPVITTTKMTFASPCALFASQKPRKCHNDSPPFNVALKALLTCHLQ